MNIREYDLPEHWASAFVNSDLTGYDDEEIAQIDAFTQEVVNEFGACWCLDVANSPGGDFRKYHDAHHLGVLACDVATFSFDVGK